MGVVRPIIAVSVLQRWDTVAARVLRFVAFRFDSRVELIEANVTSS